MAEHSSSIQRFLILDVIRGLASLSVVTWHWQHLLLLEHPSWNANSLKFLDRSAQPFYRYISLVYEYGFVAVSIFFSISGFIFFHLYEERIRRRKISAGKFFTLRLSRLYPLQLITLIVVAALQMIMHATQGRYFVYQNNDATHFLLSFLFFQDVNENAAFNGPAWSLTVEIILYLFFFLLCYYYFTKIFRLSRNMKWFCSQCNLSLCFFLPCRLKNHASIQLLILVSHDNYSFC